MRPEAFLVLAALAPALPSPDAWAQAPFVQSVPPTVPPGPAPDRWLARQVVDLVGLDKVSARLTPLTGRVGQELHLGTLTVVVRACMVRAADAAPDAAAFLDIIDDRGITPEFRAWMLLSAPSLSIYEHPVYDIRLAGCRPG